MNIMNAMEEPRAEKVETLKDILEDISAVNYEIDAQLHLIADALVYGSNVNNNDKSPDDQLTIMDSLRHERDKAAENLKLLYIIKGYLW